jgi:hypothetical protein
MKELKEKTISGNTLQAWIRAVIRLLIGAALVLTVTCCGCGKSSHEVSSEPASSTEELFANDIVPPSVFVTEPVPADPFDGRIETPVGTLIFPEEYISRVTVERSEMDGSFVQAFYSFVDEKKVMLFKLSVCDVAQGYPLGYAPDSEGRMQNIWLEIEGIENDPEWTEEQTKEVELVQSCVNDLIEQIRGLKGFVEPN